METIIEPKLELLTAEDIGYCLDMVRENYPDKDYAVKVEAEMKYMFESDLWFKPEFYVLRKSEEIVAFGAIANDVIDFDVWGGFYLNVKKKFQGSGYGKLMVRLLIKKIKEKGADVALMTCKKHNRGFYEKLGFKLLIERRDGLLMGLHLYPKQIQIRNLIEDDIQSCVEICIANQMVECWGEDTIDSLISELHAAFEQNVFCRPNYLVALIDDEIVGFAGYGRLGFDDGAYGLFWVQVHPEYQKNGIGKELTKVRIEKIKEAGGEVIIATTRKQWHLLRFGFKKILERGGGYDLMQLSPL